MSSQLTHLSWSDDIDLRPESAFQISVSYFSLVVYLFTFFGNQVVPHVLKY